MRYIVRWYAIYFIQNKSEWWTNAQSLNDSVHTQAEDEADVEKWRETRICPEARCIISSCALRCHHNRGSHLFVFCLFSRRSIYVAVCLSLLLQVRVLLCVWISKQIRLRVCRRLSPRRNLLFFLFINQFVFGQMGFEFRFSFVLVNPYYYYRDRSKAFCLCMATKRI